MSSSKMGFFFFGGWGGQTTDFSVTGQLVKELTPVIGQTVKRLQTLNDQAVKDLLTVIGKWSRI